MKLAYNLKSPSDLVAKLEREAYRAFHSRNPLAKTDHFYNFCITAHSLRDYYFKHNGITAKAEKEKWHKHWNSTPEMQASAEIANVTKHFALDRPQRTRSAAPSKSTVINIYEDRTGRIHHQAEEVFDLEIHLSDGQRIDIYPFTKAVIEYWILFLTMSNIKIERQKPEDLRSED